MAPPRKRVAIDPTMITAMGVPPDEPPGQKRWLGHATPSFNTEPSTHTWPEEASHGLQEVLPFAVAYLPKSHVEHANEEDAPKVKEYFPASHVKQLADAGEAENLAASHGAHIDNPGEDLYLPVVQLTHHRPLGSCRSSEVS